MDHPALHTTGLVNLDVILDIDIPFVKKSVNLSRLVRTVLTNATPPVWVVTTKMDCVKQVVALVGRERIVMKPQPKRVLIMRNQ